MTKTLSERRDFYSIKRVASQKVLEWLDQGIPRAAIIRKLVLEYGLSEDFYKKTLKTFGVREE